MAWGCRVGVQERASCPSSSGVTPHGCQTRVLRNEQDRTDNHGKRCRPHRKCNVNPGSFPVKEKQAASLPPSVEIRHAASHASWVLRLDGLRLQQAAPCLASYASLVFQPLSLLTKEADEQNPELSSTNRTTKPHRPFRVCAQRPQQLGPPSGVGLAPTSSLLYPIKEIITLLLSRKQPGPTVLLTGCRRPNPKNCHFPGISSGNKPLQGSTGNQGDSHKQCRTNTIRT